MAADHTCDFCESVVHEIVYPVVRKRQVPDMPRRHKSLEHIELGLLSDFRAREDCSFCSFIFIMFERFAHLYNPDRPLPPHHLVSCQIRAGSTLPNESGIRRNWDLLLRFNEVTSDDSVGLPIEEISITAMAEDIGVLQPEHAINMGRAVRMDQCDGDWIRNSYHTCTNMHGDDCDASRFHYGEDELIIKTDQLPSSFRLIDVVDMCVVDAPLDPRYVALSYVWGASNYLLLQTLNEAHLRKPAALRKHNPPLPRTLSEAIEVTRHIGERYLWIDSLCIIQDKPSDKLLKINKMGSIYARSALTIVAAHGDHANHGLTGVRSPSRRYEQVIARANGITFLSTAPSAHDIISKSAWWTRAWTFQEFRLSKRLLMFTDSVVLFHCQASDFAEDRVRYLTGGMTESEYLHEWQDLKSSFNLRGFDVQDYYSAIAGPFSQRNMTFSSDVIPAVKGVLQAMCTTLGVQYDDAFISGTPVASLFAYGLLWLPVGKMTRRPSAGTPPVSLPSWSWTGWIGPVGIWVEQIDLEKRLCYKNDDDNEVMREGITDLQYEHLPRDLRSGGTSDTLHFRAHVISLAVEDSSWGQLVPFQEQESKFTALYKVMLQDTWIGSVLLDHGNNSYRLKEPKDRFKFIILSRAVEDAIWRSGDLDEGVDLNVFDMFNSPLSEYNFIEGEEFYLLNALFVEFVEDNAHRVGIAQLHPCVKMSEECTTRLVSLA